MTMECCAILPAQIRVNPDLRLITSMDSWSGLLVPPNCKLRLCLLVPELKTHNQTSSQIPPEPRVALETAVWRVSADPVSLIALPLVDPLRLRRMAVVAMG